MLISGKVAEPSLDSANEPMESSDAPGRRRNDGARAISARKAERQSNAGESGIWIDRWIEKREGE